MKSYFFRNDPLFLRNGYESEGKYTFPIVKRQVIDLNNVNLIAYSDVSSRNTKNYDMGVHFFIDDYRFETMYNHPEKCLERLKNYRFILTPDFSLYAEMPIWRQIESVGKARWVGAYMQANGMSVIPTVSWSTTSSYEFCFKGIEKGSIVAVGMIGCKKSKKEFLRGYNEMLRQIEPSAIICFGSPFPEMGDNLVVVDYLKSRKVVR